MIDPFYGRLLAAQREVLAQPGTGLDQLEAMTAQVLALCLEHRTEVRILHYEWPRLHPNEELAEMVRASGETLDLSPTGCRVQIDDRLPAGAPVVVGLATAGGSVLVTGIARQEVQRVKGWEYRLAFEHVDDDLRRRLDRAARRVG